MPFTGKLGTVNSEPENVVPMFGAGGTRYAKSLSGQLSFSGSIVGALTHAFHNVSLAVYRAVYRAYARWSTYSVVVKGDNPTGYWRLGDPSGALTAFDSSGFANLGTLNGNITAGILGGLKDNSSAMQMDPNATSYVSQSTPVPKQTISIEALFFLPVGSSYTLWKTIYACSNFQFAVISTTQILMRTSVGSGSAVSTGGFTIPNQEGSWHHAVLTRSGNTVQIYVDGTLAGTATNFNAADWPATSASRMGADGISGIGGADNFTGKLEEEAIYPYVLTPQQITNHYAAFTAYPPAGFTTSLRTSQ